MFSVVFIFLRFGLKERDCSLRLNGESNPVPNETHSSLLFALAGGGARSNAVTQLFVARNCAEQPEAREAGG
jgi:hypothetical protein